MKKSLKHLTTLVRQYQWNSIFYKNFKKTLLVVFLPFILIICGFCVYYRSVLISETTQAANQEFLALSNTMNRVFDETERLYLQISNNVYTSLFLNAPDSASLSFHNSTNINFAMNGFQRAANESLIDSILLYSNKSGACCISREPKHLYAAEPWRAANGEYPFYVASESESGCFSICYVLRYNPTDSGIVIFNINPLLFGNTSIENSSYSFAMFDSSGKSLYSVNAPLSFDAAAFPENGEIGTEIHGSEINIRLKSNNLYLYLREENKHISPMQFSILFFAGILISVLVALILALIITADSYRSIEKIVLTINSLSNQPNSENDSEIKFICTSIANMHDKNHTLEAQLLEKVTLLKQLQLTTMQLQLTPHFLFNAMNVLNFTVMKMAGIENPASKMITLISGLLQETLHTGLYLISIGEEIENIKKYISIENLKNPDSFDFELHADEKLYAYKTVKFSLQPIVENAFKHGIKYLPENVRGKIIIDIFEANGSIIFKIANNGPQIPPPELEKMKAAFSSNIVDEHIGLFNVNKRISLIFGEQYGLDIESVPNRTTVSMTIPKTAELPEEN